jgi:hypothetical protein
MPLITGTVKDKAEAVYVGPVIVEDRDGPHTGGTFVVGPNSTTFLTESNGSIPSGTSFAPGLTRINVNGRWSKWFTVPTGSGTYDLSSLLDAAYAFTSRARIEAETIADLRTYASASTNFIAHVIQDANGAYAVFRWDADATDADDGASYVRPSDFTTAGLWVRIL